VSYQHLTFAERNVIYRMKILGRPHAEIARCLGRHPATIGREMRRNAQFDGRYFSAGAQAFANARRRAHIRRPKTGDPRLMAHVARRLERRWSPQQIAGRLRQVGSAKLPSHTLSHQTIYRWIWACPQRAERFKPYLRVACKLRRKPYGKPSKRGQIPGRVSIDQRPNVVDRRDRLGDWEGDTMVGKGRRGYVLTNVERLSRYTVARRLARPTAEATERTLVDAMRRVPAEKRRTQTFDNGREFTRHEAIARQLGMMVYFAHPYHAWERGTNENTNGLLRQYLPKGTDFRQLTDRQLASYISELNHRPRKCLNYRTPAEVYHQRPVALAM